MRTHHISCGSFNPPCARLVDGRGGYCARARYVTHCLLIELPAGGLCLVDTGLSAAELREPLRLLGPGMAWGGGVKGGRSALEHVLRLGFAAGDVRHVVMTHLDKDHAGGLADFPQAVVHAHPVELAAARERPTLLDRQRYLPRQFAHGPKWEAADPGARASLPPIEAALEGRPPIPLAGLPASILMLPLPGHTRGHCGVLVHDGVRWLLHCGDAVYHRGWLDGPQRRPAPLLRLVERVLQADGPERLRSVRLLQRIADSGAAEVFCSHDRSAFEALGGTE